MTRFRAVDLIASGTADLESVLAFLEAIDLSELAVFRNHFTDDVLNQGSPDAAIGVLDPLCAIGKSEALTGVPSRASAFTNEDVLLRLGRLIGKGVPSLVIVPPPLIPPAPMASLVVAPCPLDDRESLKLHLWAFMSSLAGLRARSKNVANTQSTEFGEVASWLRGPKRSLLSHAVSPTDFEELVVRLLQDQGAELVENPDRMAKDAGFDAVFLPAKGAQELVLVEAKVGRLDVRQIVDSGRSLQRCVIERRGDLGLLIYHDRAGRRFDLHGIPRVVAISVDELIHALRVNNLRHVIAEQVAKVGG
ncbi:restriction endonuclease [Micromonospora echinospora]|uniref:restriction endonuclease n=2 Tax=Micromonospora echinospora TaxID=1877 RepID=UPI003A887F21